MYMQHKGQFGFAVLEKTQGCTYMLILSGMGKAVSIITPPVARPRLHTVRLDIATGHMDSKKAAF